jgi:hypothetical protein
MVEEIEGILVVCIGSRDLVDSLLLNPAIVAGGIRTMWQKGPRGWLDRRTTVGMLEWGRGLICVQDEVWHCLAEDNQAGQPMVHRPTQRLRADNV